MNGFTREELMIFAISIYHLHRQDGLLGDKYFEEFDEVISSIIDYIDAQTGDNEDTQSREKEISSKVLDELLKQIAKM